MKAQDTKSKLCPFKKIVERDYNGKTGRQTINERFAPCAGERCMAYIDGSFFGCHCRMMVTEAKRGT